VQAYLEDRALVNLAAAANAEGAELDGAGIHVKGPEYVEATIWARVVPERPERADEIELKLLQQLEAFLHPLRGGPERTGWQLGRDVVLSEIYAEMESVSGVDHVAAVRLIGSVQQYRLRLEEEDEGYRRVPFDLPVGCQVSSFDGRIRLRLGQPLSEGVALTHLAVYGFKAGDLVNVVAADNRLVKEDLTIVKLSGDRVSVDPPFVPPADWAERNALMSPDDMLRLPLEEDGIITDSEDKVTGMHVRGFQAEDRDVSVVVGTRRDPALEFLSVEDVQSCHDRIFVPEGHLIHSGGHNIEMIVE
jgi:hypothetical protein